MDIFTIESMFTTSSVIFLVVYGICAAVALVITARYYRSRRALLDRLAERHPQEWRRLGRPSAHVGDMLGDKRAACSRGRFRHWLLSTSDSLGDPETDALVRRTRRRFYLTAAAVVPFVIGTGGYLIYENIAEGRSTGSLIIWLTFLLVFFGWWHSHSFKRRPPDR